MNEAKIIELLKGTKIGGHFAILQVVRAAAAVVKAADDLTAAVKVLDGVVHVTGIPNSDIGKCVDDLREALYDASAWTSLERSIKGAD